LTVTEKKTVEEILSLINNDDNFFIIGCGECATTCSTGGEKEVKEMADFLSSKGKTVTGFGVCQTTCDIRLLKKFLREHKESFDKSSSVIILSCGAGAQAIREISDKKMITGVNTKYLGTVERIGNYKNFCIQCGTCTASNTFGFCTKTRCAKGLLNGPCGNSKDGMCEEGSDKPCVWVEIYEYLKKQGREREFVSISLDNNFDKSKK
jgi:ferredoxin